MKKGRLSKEEVAYIEKHVKTDSTDQIAKHLDRNPESVEKHIKKKYGKGASAEEIAAFDLDNRPYWHEIKNQFTDEELKLFRYHWSRIISQFRDDVIPTEEIQVLDLIKLELLMNRSLKNNKSNIEQISVMEALVQEERARDPDQQNADMIFNLERQVASLRASQESLNKDYRELQTKKNSMLKEMKATREQRVKRLEDSKQSLTGWIAYLMSNPDVTTKYGIEMEKMRLAMSKERDRLSNYHKYQDGIVDQPFLNSDTIKE
jgi:hypothetical protein|tara:strand:- start:2329 stop:3114 length:786 start_codon:yes stop_codon:yes gene_type:complete